MIARAARQLPSQITPPSYQKVNPGDFPVLFLNLRSATLPLTTVNEYAESTISQQISTVTGVAQVQAFGGAKYAVRIDVDPRKLSAHGIGMDEVVTAIQAANVNLPTGTIYGQQRSFTVLADGQLFKAAAYEPLIISYRNGNPVRLGEVARIYEGVEQDKAASWYQNSRNITLAIFKQPGTNVVSVVDEIRKLMPTFRELLPPSVSLDVRTDRSESIRESVHDVKLTLWLTFGLVVVVIFIFLRNFTATLIPSLTLPVTIVATFAVMYLLNYSLDNLSLMALTLRSVRRRRHHRDAGEHRRHMEMGKSPCRPRTVRLDGGGSPSRAMTVSLVAVFVPVLFMGGIVGRLLRVPVTIGAAISHRLRVDQPHPHVCSRFLKATHWQKH